ncbi:hypothetical protein Y032_0370g98 [Ancylostoma ceylanicum]|uniref:Uncharacterized protein n=1 Tax=Ancylostoma ceylanicum TaxID=53326 RepID=A0A016RV72_9BILA|nr:hypothetical protein Y032_0370g98 [Ancylostoma ceylanicum]
MAEATRFDLIYNYGVRKRFGVAATSDKLCESRLRWYDDVPLADEDTKWASISTSPANDQKVDESSVT